MTFAVWKRTLLIGLVVLAAGAALLTARPAAAARLPDLQVSMAYPGGNLGSNVTVTVLNAREIGVDSGQVGGGPASGVVMRYTAPQQMTVQSVSVTTGGFACSIADRVVTCTGGTLANGQRATFTVVLSVTPGTPPYNPGASWCTSPHTAVVDPANTIVEREESNNSASLGWFHPTCIG